MPALVERRTRTTRVASVARAVRVLEAFAGHPAGVALTRLSAQLGYGKPSLSKILATLEREGFVRRDAAGLFHLSWRLLALALGHAHRLGISGICAPILQSLADDTDELVQLAVVDGEHVLFVAKAEGPGPQVRMLPLIGVAPPVHATASGKVWLASLPEATALRIIRARGLPRITPRTITSVPRLLGELRRAREQGYAITDEELAVGGRAVAVPILHDARVVAAVAVSGPSFRLSLSRLQRLVPRLRRAADDLQAVWPQAVSAADFGLGIRSANGHGRRKASS
jgi:DNA-binding IclR family transcriptional regulator